MEVTIIHDGGTEVVTDFHHIEEVNLLEGSHPDIKVWLTDPDREDSRYNLYTNASVTEVKP